MHRSDRMARPLFCYVEGARGVQETDSPTLVVVTETSFLLQVVAGCYTDQRPALFPLQFPEVVRALDYFAVPQALWPLAVLTQAAVKEAHAKRCIVAEGLLNIVMDQLPKSGHLHRYRDQEQVSEMFVICQADDGSLTAKSCDLQDLEAGIAVEWSSVHIDCALGAAMQHIAQLHHITLQFVQDRFYGDGVFEAKTVIPGVL